MRLIIRALSVTFLLCGHAPLSAAAQEATLAFEGLQSGAGQPVEITADVLSINQKASTAIFTGNVLVIQGELRLSADEMLVEYLQGDKSKIDKLHASGHVLLATSTEAAEAQKATYSMTNRQIEMTGDVLLTQKDTAIAGQKLVIDLTSGTGKMEGRVKTVLQPGGN